MSKWLLNTIGFAILVALGFASWGGWCLYPHVTAMLDAARIPDLRPTIDQTNSVLTKANTAVGNLADATGDWSDASKQQARDVRAALAAGGRLLDASTEDAKALKSTLQTAQGTAQALTETLGEGKRTIQTAQPLLSQSSSVVADLDAMLKDHAINETLDNVQAVTQNAASITLDLRQVADKTTADYLKPVPWWKWPLKRAGQFWDIGAAVARHTP